MERDPFYRLLVDRLAGRLDPDAFERCAAALVRLEGVLVVPVKGGSDAGMDAAMGDMKGEAFPLVCTTAKDVIGNFTRSLHSYVEKGGTRRKIALATSQSLSPPRQRNIRNRAREYGFALVLLVEQEGMATLLYRSPAWCQELLGLSADPPALSAIPVTSRPHFGAAVVGRDEAARWLTDTGGDVVLFGQPGSGKTHLLRSLVRGGWGLFVVSRDPGQIAASIRETEAPVLIVDDAHLDPEFLPRLRHLREELGEEFRIVATSWLAGRDEVAEMLQAGGEATHQLTLLSRDEMVQVVIGCGIEGSTDLIREIVDQSEGKPGLAATLCHLVLRGEARSVVFGDALARFVRLSLAPSSGRHAVQLLAGLSFGGEAGLGLETTALALGMTTADAQLEMAVLAAGGVIEETVGFPRNDPALVVRPDALRYALIRDVAFGQPGFPWRRFIDAIDRPNQALTTLVASTLRGARIPRHVLRELAAVSGDEGLEAFAYLGAEESRWVLDTEPDKALAVAAPALRNAPSAVIPLLLTMAIGDERMLHSSPDHPLRLLSDWVRVSAPGSGDAVSRRLTLARSAEQWISAGGDRTVGSRALAVALDPSHERHEVDPGGGMTVSFRWGPLSASDIDSMPSVWEVVRRSYADSGVDWPSALGAMHKWAHPGLLSQRPVSGDVQNSLFAGARRMITDLLDLADDHPGVIMKLEALAGDVGLTVRVSIPADFAILFPPEDYSESVHERLERQRSAVESLATQLAAASPVDVANRLVSVEEEARLAGVVWPRYTALLATHLSDLTESPIEWIEALVGVDAPGDVAAPFIDQACSERPRGWEEAISELMTREPYALTASEGVLRGENSDGALVDRAIGIVGASPFGAQVVETLALRLEIPPDTLLRLLTDGTREVATAAAVGEWLSDPQGTVREGLVDSWKPAILDAPDEEYWVGEILAANQDLALDWLLKKLTDGKFTALYLSDHEATTKAVAALGPESRRAMIDRLPESGALDDLAAHLVASDVSLYRALLSRSEVPALHLAPLRGYPNESWPDFAIAAAEAGYPPEEIGLAAFSGLMSWTGNESDMWSVWETEFTVFMRHESTAVRESARAAVEHAVSRRTSALERERDEAVRGLERSRGYRRA